MVKLQHHTHTHCQVGKVLEGLGYVFAARGGGRSSGGSGAPTSDIDSRKSSIRERGVRREEGFVGPRYEVPALGPALSGASHQRRGRMDPKDHPEEGGRDTATIRDAGTRNKELGRLRNHRLWLTRESAAGTQARARQKVCGRRCMAWDMPHLGRLHVCACIGLWSCGHAQMYVNMVPPGGRCRSAPHLVFCIPLTPLMTLQVGQVLLSLGGKGQARDTEQGRAASVQETFNRERSLDLEDEWGDDEKPGMQELKLTKSKASMPDKAAEYITNGDISKLRNHRLWQGRESSASPLGRARDQVGQALFAGLAAGARSQEGPPHASTERAGARGGESDAGDGWESSSSDGSGQQRVTEHRSTGRGSGTAGGSEFSPPGVGGGGRGRAAFQKQRQTATSISRRSSSSLMGDGNDDEIRGEIYRGRGGADAHLGRLRGHRLWRERESSASPDGRARRQVSRHALSNVWP